MIDVYLNWKKFRNDDWWNIGTGGDLSTRAKVDSSDDEKHSEAKAAKCAIIVKEFSKCRRPKDDRRRTKKKKRARGCYRYTL